MKNKGPRIVPWGTPWFNVNQSDTKPFKTTRCSLRDKKLLKSSIVFTPILSSLNFCIKMRCDIESKAFDRSRNAAATLLFLSSSDLIFSVVNNKASIVDYPGRNPNCLAFSIFSFDRYSVSC